MRAFLCVWQILWDHDTVFHGEDLYMGLLLHRMRKNYAIMVSAGAVVPTFAPENMLILFRQRVTSWDLCAQVPSCVPLMLLVPLTVITRCAFPACSVSS